MVNYILFALHMTVTIATARKSFPPPDLGSSLSDDLRI